MEGSDAVEGLERVNRPSAESFFWLFALIYAAMVILILIKTAPGFGHHGLAAMPALTVTLPTSVVLMIFAPKSMGLGGLIAITVVGAVVNIGFVYAILFGYESRKGDR